MAMFRMSAKSRHIKEIDLFFRYVIAIVAIFLIPPAYLYPVYDA
jgi:hypothetical protein